MVAGGGHANTPEDPGYVAWATVCELATNGEAAHPGGKTPAIARILALGLDHWIFERLGPEACFCDFLGLSCFLGRFQPRTQCVVFLWPAALDGRCRFDGSNLQHLPKTRVSRVGCLVD